LSCFYDVISCQCDSTLICKSGFVRRRQKFCTRVKAKGRQFKYMLLAEQTPINAGRH